MLPKVSRYFLVIVAIVVLANVLPQIYNTLFDVRINRPYITYSNLTGDFFIMNTGGKKLSFSDTKGNKYSQEEFMNKTPVVNAFYQVANGILPDSLNGVKLNINELRNETFRQFIRSQQFSSPAYRLYPLFESKPKFGLHFPDDFFRINDRIEFIDAKTNKIEEVKSEKFTKALQNAGFKFPADVISGIPSPMKSRADGWFLTDSRGALYHLKMVKGDPYVRHISTPDNFKIKKIFCTDFRNREFYAVIVANNDHLYILGNPNYKLTKFPIADYKSGIQNLQFSGNLFNRLVVISDHHEVKAYSLDRDYQTIDIYKKQRRSKSEMLVGKIFDVVFPFHINFQSSKSRFIKFAASGYENLYWIYLNIIFLGITFFIIKRKRRKISNNILDLLIVAGTGIFGFIAIFLFPNKEF